eukprot:maker-scaffold22_size673200-snap-gene-3.25 protein:Tk12680 transcript:maker-scaffold22_size673200-snap-gene-3.25-mRNA-1 annotation:"ww domain-binding protein 11"
MGKRSTNTTKSGKFMNPTDQARKEARKKELKKNKKQRQMVRTAVLKGKNPHEIVRELEKLDDMEYNVLSPPPLNDKVLRDKRRKLHETWNRVMGMYEKEDVTQFVDLKKLWHNYLSRKKELTQQFDAVRNAENVMVDDIPMPSGNTEEGPEGIPLPPGGQGGMSDSWKANAMTGGGILKRPSALESLKPKVCPGPPATVPPKLEDYKTAQDSLEGTARETAVRFDAGAKKPLDQAQQIQLKMVALAGQDIDQYMKKLEEVHKSSQGALGHNEPPVRALASMEEPPMRMPPPPAAHLKPDWMDKPKSVSFKPNELFPPGAVPPGVQLPPGPPPPMMRHPFPDMGMGGPPSRPVIPPPVRNTYVQKTSSIIEAKPQMRNLKSISTRFIPTNVKLRQAHHPGKDPEPHPTPVSHHHQPRVPNHGNSKDDAYAQFMTEMNKLLH